VLIPAAAPTPSDVLEPCEQECERFISTSTFFGFLRIMLFFSFLFAALWVSTFAQDLSVPKSWRAGTLSALMLITCTHVSIGSR
jgi:hypothetical protein